MTYPCDISKAKLFKHIIFQPNTGCIVHKQFSSKSNERISKSLEINCKADLASHDFTLPFSSL